MTDNPKVQHFSDLLCIWAHISDIRLERLAERYAGRVGFDIHFCSVFPDARTKIEAAWAGRGGGQAFRAHLRKVAGRFDHIQLHENFGLGVMPASSTGPHLFVKAARLVEEANAAVAGLPLVERRHYRLITALRRVLFEQARDIGLWKVQCECAEALGFDIGAVEARLHSGEAAAMLDRDMALAQKLHVTGSPTFVMNEGRQVLYGNVGYRLLEANVEELLHVPGPGEASWC